MPLYIKLLLFSRKLHKFSVNIYHSEHVTLGHELDTQFILIKINKIPVQRSKNNYTIIEINNVKRQKIEKTNDEILAYSVILFDNLYKISFSIRILRFFPCSKLYMKGLSHQTTFDS